MTGADPVASALAEIPGAGAPVFDAGAWRLRTTPGALPAVMRALLDRGGVLALVAGEDREGVDDLGVHYLVASPQPRWTLVHVEVGVPRGAPVVPSLALWSFPASRFERELRDLFGIEPAGHPDPRPLVRHGFWPETFHPLRRDAPVPDFDDRGQPFPFTPVSGDGVYEIPVGPVHAGVIEPGHFRFSVLGETILEMRARLYFTHKGTERLFAGRRPDEAVELAERISGDTSVGHAVAFCQAVETLAGVTIPAAAAAQRTALLELERLYNHVTDVGAIIADTGFAVVQSHCLRLRETLLRLHKRVAGHRLLRGVVVPGGVRGLEALDAGIVPELRRVLADFDEIVAICQANTLVADRLEATGRLDAAVARDFGVVGYVARASGVAHDARRDLPSAAYDAIAVEPVVETAGDVRARFLVRVREARQAVAIVEAALDRLDGSASRADLPPLRAHVPAFGIVEAWRGRLVHMVVAGADGRLARVKVVDPSFFNWPALSRALEDNIVPDFPLCNKSFNQSYSGNDL